MPIWLLAIFKPSNFAGIFKFIGRNWKFIVIGAMVFCLWYQNFSGVKFVFGIETIPALKQEVSELENALNTCVDGNKLLSDTIDTRNEEIAKWGQVSEEFKQKIEDLKDDLVEERARTKIKVVTVLSEPAPETCEAAIEYLRDSTEDLKWEE